MELVSKKEVVALLNSDYAYGSANYVDKYAKPVVDLVFCKDCKYLMEYGDKYKLVAGAYGICLAKMGHSTSTQFIECQEDGFCSYGELKGE